MPDADDPAWALAIDFGTSNTAATIQRLDTGKVQPVRLSPQGWTMPSGVLAEGGGLVVGVAAARRARIDPAAYEPSPKLRIGDETMLLGEEEHEVVDLVAAVLRKVAEEAARVAPSAVPSVVRLTHPERWSSARRDELRQAAVRAGLSERALHLVSESVAAAQHYARANAVPAGGLVAVVDVGAGTCDTALLRAEPPDFRVLAAHGDAELGGIDIDERLRGWVLAQLREQGREDLVDGLARSPADELVLKDQVRYAKEELSEYQSATVRIGPLRDARGSTTGPGVDVTTTRDEFDRLIAPEVDRIVVLTDRTLQQGMPPGEPLHALYLAGGTSLIPLLHERLQQLVGAPPATLDDPKLVVATGAHHEAPAEEASSAAPPPPLFSRRVLVGAALIALLVFVGGLVLGVVSDDSADAGGGTSTGTALTTETTATAEAAPSAGPEAGMTGAPADSTGPPRVTGTSEPENVSAPAAGAGTAACTFSGAQPGPDGWTGHDTDGDGVDTVFRRAADVGCEQVIDLQADGINESYYYDEALDGTWDFWVFASRRGTASSFLLTRYDSVGQPAEEERLTEDDLRSRFRRAHDALVP